MRKRIIANMSCFTMSAKAKAVNFVEALLTVVSFCIICVRPCFYACYRRDWSVQFSLLLLLLLLLSGRPQQSTLSHRDGPPQTSCEHRRDLCLWGTRRSNWSD